MIKNLFKTAIALTAGILLAAFNLIVLSQINKLLISTTPIGLNMLIQPASQGSFYFVLNEFVLSVLFWIILETITVYKDKNLSKMFGTAGLTITLFYFFLIQNLQILFLKISLPLLIFPLGHFLIFKFFKEEKRVKTSIIFSIFLAILYIILLPFLYKIPKIAG